MGVPNSVSEVFAELMKLAKTSIETYGAAVKAEKGNPPASPEEIAQRKTEADAARTAFNRRLNEAVGSDRQRSKDWNFSVQKAYVFGLITKRVGNTDVPNESVFHYIHGDGILARSLMLQARAYLNGHNALGWTVEHGLNPRSVQNLERALVSAERTAVESYDVNRLQPIRAALSELRRHCENLLRERTQTAPQPVPTEMEAALRKAQGATAETPQPTAAPRPRTTRRGR